MKGMLSIILGLLLAVTVLVLSGALYVVDETQQVVVTKFGQLVGKPKTEAGLYWKFPWEQANYFDKRILEWDGDANEIPTLDKRYIWVDTMARWKIVDPLRFMQSVRTEPSAQSRLDDLIDAATREVISRHRLIEVIRSSNRILEDQNQEEGETQTMAERGETELAPIGLGREELARRISLRAAETTPQFGIQLVDVRIKRINYKEEVRQKVYERMISERKRAAEMFRAEGQGKKAEIEGQMVKELKEIQSEAYREAQLLKGKADAQAIQIYADAYNQDPEFYSFVKTLETYRKTVNKETQLILSTDSTYFKVLNGGWEGAAE
ncbi:MAG: protease modulator HflC [Candidatus Omnitrophica bacterium]|nr:protease modulator HflC [Candidatus Omnitrophota bacterium]MCB9721364.1 protease modulator HflC [Candidatus Omnitrophota bacterium]